MKQINDHLKKWDVARIIKLILASLLGMAYFYDKEPLFLLAGFILSAQAIFNISCSSGNCSTGVGKDTKPIVKTEKYEPKNN